ncbi:putative mitochondrial hypothetical protein [Leptomonas pyrrhocoris]|uniref:Uncharacterized protein n=1 Tax=Leptomonas pyrrhocoris TaxID=157538 RepID=A0A0N0VDP4_LEPPY|nr:putative mitochondrial hypothetical protein [Leptomonas pyrrhocoris]KPA76202.1 putative mitochondrial hypothetical protein [Leptomonas pyrrhocoris]|eukprot:XP_015654641.1 putative mitochondrial hypothetical protein [Leptomonas pyrrhocoris]
MQRRFQSLFQPRRGGLFCVDALFSAQRKVNGCQRTGGREEDEDPAVVLRKLQEEMRKRSLAEGKEIPPTPPRRSGKTNFFDSNPKPENTEEQDTNRTQEDSRHPQSGPHSQSNVKRKGGAETKTSNPFLQKLTKMEVDTQSTSFPTYDAAAEERRKKIDAKIKEERSKMVVFRDVGMDLDKPILSRDVFLIFKYFRYGSEFAVDNELERMLRYFNEHATNELKIIQDSKLMRGPPTLSRKRRHTPRPRSSAQSFGNPTLKNDQREHDELAVVRQQQQALQFQVSSFFPRVRCANTRQFCSPGSSANAVASTLSTLLSASHNSSSFAPFLPSAAAEENKKGSTAAKKSFNARDDGLFTVMSPSMFRRPAVVIYSQLGQRFGSQADTEWRRLAYTSICPGLLPYIPMLSNTAKEVKDETAGVQSPYSVSGQTGKKKDGSFSRSSASSRSMPIDVISLRSVDVYKYAWVQRMYVNRFAKSLSQTTSAAGSTAAGEPSVAEVNRALIASTTFVGSQLLQPFYTTLGLRNYLLPHVMLVDHEGVIRWLSGGCPDANEEAVFSSLLRQLESEYYKASK